MQLKAVSTTKDDAFVAPTTTAEELFSDDDDNDAAAASTGNAFAQRPLLDRTDAPITDSRVTLILF